MAAFLERLFKSRKTAAPGKKAPPQTQQATESAEDKRAVMRQEQLQALQAHPSEDAAAILAIEGLTAEIRLKAAGFLQDAELLHKVQKQAKGRDKSVYQEVRQKLQLAREEQARQEAISESIITLIANARDQAASDDTQLYEARLNKLLSQWASVESSATPEQLSEFLASVHLCRERLSDLKAAQAAVKHEHEQQIQREETLELIARTLEDLRHQPTEALASLASLDALQKTQENRWLEATRDTRVEKQQQKAYETSMMALRNYINAIRQISQKKEALLALSGMSVQDASPEDQDNAVTLLKEINWPEGFPAPEILEPARKLAGKPKAAVAPGRGNGDQKQQQETSDNLRATLAQLEDTLEAKQLKESRQLLKTAQQYLKALDQRHSKNFQARVQLLTGQLRELTDWQGFVTEPKQIALCEQMEYLAQQPMEPEAKSERIKELQKEWRELGGSSDRTLWSRFKQASDEAYEPCKAYFKAKSGLKQANLEKRKAICAELEHFVNAAEWDSIDWKAVERILQTARQEWKSAWPVEFRDNRQVQKQFDELLKKLEAPIDQERRKNEALKLSIVEQAQALIEHEPLQEAMNKAKALQSEWKSIGITRHREDRKLWQAFRKACDAIFERRDLERSEQQHVTKEADAAAETLLQQLTGVGAETGQEALEQAIAELDNFDASQTSAGVREQIQNRKKRLRQLVSAQKLKAGIAEWQALVLTRTETGVSPGPLSDKWVSLAENMGELNDQEIVIRAEILAGVPSPEADQKKRMEIQVQRLAEGMGSSDTADSPVKNMEGLIASWCVKPTDEPADPSLAARLNRALDNLLES
ncbi:hypothetical protein GCM10011533_34160 [Streptosporangium jomthongense]|uniref:DUF349 domain-containing protein n=1 Tax=Marinobacter aromaticivorans TaxID=1494078 RepID=A0ABW2IZ17_9GAMM|nr:DUF349 domain-containing protein [Marinobacter aromaticivorans]GGE79004.1 hypothetical protein GCM10011533_34160 [Streptosporangium jomthongense]